MSKVRKIDLLATLIYMVVAAFCLMTI